MNWSRQTIEPRRVPPEAAKRFRYSSPPLCRMFGAIGFIAGGLLVFYGIVAFLGIDPGFISDDAEWSFSKIVALGSSLIAGMLFGLIGFGMGMSVKVVSDDADHRLSVLWHYVANGFIIWTVLLSFALTKALGEEGVKQLFRELGAWSSTLTVAGPVLVGTLVLASILLLTKQLRIDSKPSLLPCFLMSVPITLVMAYVQYKLLGLHAGHWVVVGIILPLALIPISSMTVARDARQRREFLSEMRK